MGQEERTARKEVDYSMGKLPEVLKKKLTMATRDLRKRIGTLIVTKERAKTLEEHFTLLKAGKLPKSIRRPGMGFECTTLEKDVQFELLQFPITFSETNLVFSVASGDGEKKHAIETCSTQLSSSNSS